MNHCCGKKPFNEVHVEMARELGHSPTRVEMFNKCYTNSTGNPSSSEAAIAMGEMKEKTGQLPPDSVDFVGPDDIYSHVRGPDKYGRVRMLGSGVHASDVWGELPSHSTSHRIIEQQKAELEKLQKQLNEQATQLREQGQDIAEMRAMLLPHRKNLSSHSSIAPSLGSNPSSMPGNGTRVSSESSPNPRTDNGALRVSNSVSLLSVFDNSKVVAQGRIIGMDPSSRVGGQELGENWCEVEVSVALHHEERLIRPYDFIQTIGDAIGVPVAWPCPLVRRYTYNAD